MSPQLKGDGFCHLCHRLALDVEYVVLPQHIDTSWRAGWDTIDVGRGFEGGHETKLRSCQAASQLAHASGLLRVVELDARQTITQHC